MGLCDGRDPPDVPGSGLPAGGLRERERAGEAVKGRGSQKRALGKVVVVLAVSDRVPFCWHVLFLEFFWKKKTAFLLLP